MKKQLKSILILVLVVLFLGAGVTVLVLTSGSDNGGDDGNKPNENKFTALFETEKSDISSISISTSENNFTINRSASGTFGIDILKDSPENADTVELTANYLASPKVKTGFLIENAKDLSTYGLDNPSEQYTLTLNDGTVKTFAFGISTAANDGYYMMDTANNNIYIVPLALHNYITMTPLDYISKSLIPALGENAITSFEQIEIGGTQKENTIKIVSVKDDERDESLSYYDIYKLTAPIEYAVDDYKMQTLFSQLSGLTASSAVSLTADSESLTKFGIDNPSYTFKIDFPDKSYTLTFGNTADDGDIYVTVSGKNAVYKISKSNVAFIEMTEFDFARRTDIIPKIDDVSAITINANGTKYTFVLKGTDDNLTVTCNGKELDTDLFRSFYINLISMNMEGGMAKPDILSPADMYFKVEYEYKDTAKKNDIIEYYNVDGRKYFRLTNGEGFFYSLKDTLDNVIKDIDKLLKGQPITER